MLSSGFPTFSSIFQYFSGIYFYVSTFYLLDLFYCNRSIYLCPNVYYALRLHTHSPFPPLSALLRLFMTPFNFWRINTLLAFITHYGTIQLPNTTK